MMTELTRMPLDRLLDEMAASSPGPAAGSAAALAAASAAALVGLVARLTAEKARSGAGPLQARYAPYGPRAEEIAKVTDDLRAVLLSLLQRDADLVSSVIRRRRLQAVPIEGAVWAGEDPALVGTLMEVLRSPLQIARAAVQVAGLAGELRDHGYRSAAPDAAAALTLALAAAESCLLLVEVNPREPGEDPTRTTGLADEIAALRASIGELRALN